MCYPFLWSDRVRQYRPLRGYWLAVPVYTQQLCLVVSTAVRQIEKLEQLSAGIVGMFRVWSAGNIGRFRINNAFKPLTRKTRNRTTIVRDVNIPSTELDRRCGDQTFRSILTTDNYLINYTTDSLDSVMTVGSFSCCIFIYIYIPWHRRHRQRMVMAWR